MGVGGVPLYTSSVLGPMLFFLMKGYIRQCTANMQKVLEVRVCCCAYVYGESLLTFGERGIQKTLISFVLAQSSWMLYYNNK